MASITFSENRAWVVAGWAFRQLLEDVRVASSDPAVLEELESAEILGFLSMKDVEPSLRSRMIAVLSSVVQEYMLGLQELQDSLASLKGG
jgi:hypothetical protein